MISLLALAGFGAAVSASAIVPHSIPRHEKNYYPFDLRAVGPHSANGVIKQIEDGQNRIGGGQDLGNYNLKNGSVWDEHGRGCILTPEVNQWQCDQGVRPTPGFGIDCEGKFTYQDDETFYACPVNDHGEWNIYTKPVSRQLKCVQITLVVPGDVGIPGCRPAAHSPRPTSTSTRLSTITPVSSKTSSTKSTSTQQPITSSPPTPTPSSSQKRCPADLEGPYEFPHLIVPVDRSNPDEKTGNGLNGTFVAPDVCTGFNFDVHPRFAGKTCSLVFLLPEHDELETSAYELGGKGGLAFAPLDAPMQHESTWNTKPKPMDAIRAYPIEEGSTYHLFTTPCPAGKTVAYGVCSTGNLTLNYFQDFNPSPIGLYIRVC